MSCVMSLIESRKSSRFPVPEIAFNSVVNVHSCSCIKIRGSSTALVDSG